jgi:2-polyprenyl-3-methyl-5-hydroxy-6-metoxy-1,4-benzoquinol methylase
MIENADWPSHGLEKVSKCPACGSRNRSIMYKDLTDCIFSCAPGKWSLYRCDRCASAYLDPRPTSDTVSLAYRIYFTHIDQHNVPRRGLRWLNLATRNAYLNSIWGTSFEPTFKCLSWIQCLIPGNAAFLEHEMRHLPRPAKERRLLDIGCGNGAFLSIAKSAGWNVVGVDIDPKAVLVAASKGLNIREGEFDSINEPDSSFDAITLSHVIEHVDSPYKLVKECRRLLKHDGFFWLETPNIESSVHQKFGSSWRGLEVPRHFTIFSRSSLIDLLHRSGFTEIEDAPWAPISKCTWSDSLAISKSAMMQLEARQDYIRRFVLRVVDSVLRVNPNKRDFITLIAK